MGQLAHTPSGRGSGLSRYPVKHPLYRVLARMLCTLSSGVPAHLIHGFSGMVLIHPCFWVYPI